MRKIGVLVLVSALCLAVGYLYLNPDALPKALPLDQVVSHAFKGNF